MSARFANPKRRCSSLSEIPRKKMQIFWRHFIQTFKTLIQFIFSHIGLTGSVVAYSIVGGWIFMGLEAPHELKLREQINTIRNHYVKLILNASEMHENNWNEENSLENITYEYITRFEKEIVQFIDGTGWNGLGDETELQWSYAGALLYSVTVITTIGYGHIAPKTDWGRIVTIVYAIFGIPLTLLCLRTIGSLMAGTFKFIYFHICYRLYLRWQQFRFYVRRKRQEHKRRIEKARMAFEELFEKGNEIWRSTEMLFTNGNEEENKEKGNEDMSFNLKSKKDLQNQEFQKDRNANRRLKYQRMKRNQKQMRTAAATMGTAAAGTATAAVETAAVTAGTAAAIAAAAAGTAAAGPSSESTMEVNRFIGNQFFAEEPENIDKASDIETLELRSGMEPQSPASSSQSKRKKLQQQQRVPDDCEPLNRVPQVRVPILISLLVISAYIFLGAVLFSLWEKNWDYLISSYFCFVTLSTIGFGDFVPGSEVESWSSAEKQAICTLYLLFGMAMIAMCFNLIQQEIILKFTDFGLRIGLIEERRLSMRLEEQSTD